jgi:hypothetical protein
MNEKWKQLIDLIVNEEEDKANELFHEIVIESSRGIYENLITSEDLVDEAAVEEVSDDEVNNFISDIEADEEGISEEDDDIEDAEAELEDEMEIVPDGEEAGEDEGEEELEDRVVDLEDELEALKAEFNELMNDGDEAPAEEPEMEAVESVEEAADEEVSEESEEVVEDEEVVVEYAEKAPAPQGGSDDNAKSAVAKSGKGGMKNAPSGEEKGAPAPKAQDMGGTTKPDMKKV